MTKLENIHVFYELAMSIGKSLDLNKMLQKAILTYLRKLNCTAAIVYQLVPKSEDKHLTKVIFKMPFTLKIEENLDEVHQSLSKPFTHNDIGKLLSTLPTAGVSSTMRYYHIMPLYDFGFLVLVKNKKHLQLEILLPLEDLNQKLALACHSCINNETANQNKKRFQALSDSTFESIFFARKGICTNQNKAAEKMFGYSLAEITSLQITQLVFPEFKNKFKAILNDFNEEPFEATAIRKDKSTLICKIQGKKVVVDNEEINVFAFNDITAQKEAQLEKLHSEEKYRIITQSTLDIIFSIDYLDELLFISDSVANFLGYQAHEMIGNTLQTYISDGYKYHYIEKLHQLFSESEFTGFQTRLQRKDGSLIDVEINGKLTIHNDDPMGVGIIHDISQHIKDKAALQESEQQQRLYAKRLELALLGSESGLWDWNIKTGEVFFSERWCTMLGYHPSEIRPHVSTWEDLVHPEDMPQVNKALDLHLERKTEVYKTEHRVKTKQGHWLWILDTGKVTERDKNGKALRIVGTHIDITERINVAKKLENERDRANQANKAKSEFLANMSHEIRTPMNAILGFSEALYNRLEFETNRKLLKSVVSSGKLLMSLLNDILDLSKIEAGKLVLSPQPVNFQDIIDEITMMFREKANQKGISLNVNIADNFPKTIELDEIRIKQVLFNIIGNAVKFTHQGYVHIALKFTYATETIGKLTLEISDTGIGISPKEQVTIFEAFRQVVGQDNRKYGGAGLGLAISKRLTEKMGGNILLKSKLGRSSTFTIEIPETKISFLEQTRSETNISFNDIQFSPATLMVVDDVEYNIQTIENLLSQSNFNILTANSGEVALETLQFKLPDLILLDIRMTGEDGFAVSKKIRENPLTAHIPIIAYTASVFSADKIKTTSSFDDVLFKPTNLSEVLSLLSKFLQHEYKSSVRELISTKKTYELTQENKQQIDEIRTILNETIAPEWADIKDSLVLYKIDKFISNLSDFVEVYQIVFIKDYVKQLSDDMEIVDLESLKEHLNQFEQIIHFLNDKKAP